MTQTPTPAYRPLRRSRTDRMLAGICGGAARYLGIDPVAARVLFVVLTLVTGGGAILAYLITWAIMPDEDAHTSWTAPSA